MSYEDDMNEDIVIERAMHENAVNRFVKEVNENKVLRDIQGIVFQSKHDNNQFARKIKEILHTINRKNGTMSDKQKWCLCRFLHSHDEDYGINEEVDHPFNQ